MELLKSLGAVFIIVGSIALVIWYSSVICQVYQNKRNIAALLNEAGFESDGPLELLKPKEAIKEKA